MGMADKIRRVPTPKSRLYGKSDPRKVIFLTMQELVFWKYNIWGRKKSFGEGVCLVGKILLHPVGVFLSYLEAPSSHIVKKEKY